MASRKFSFLWQIIQEVSLDGEGMLPPARDRNRGCKTDVAFSLLPVVCASHPWTDRVQLRSKIQKARSFWLVWAAVFLSYVVCFAFLHDTVVCFTQPAGTPAARGLGSPSCFVLLL